MTAAKALEYKITRQLLQRGTGKPAQLDASVWADRLISVIAATAGVFLLGTYLQELLWVLLVAASIFTLGTPAK